jgi:hypothetical protein
MLPSGPTFLSELALCAVCHLKTPSLAFIYYCSDASYDCRSCRGRRNVLSAVERNRSTCGRTRFHAIASECFSAVVRRHVRVSQVVSYRPSSLRLSLFRGSPRPSHRMAVLEYADYANLELNCSAKHNAHTASLHCTIQLLTALILCASPSASHLRAVLLLSLAHLSLHRALFMITSDFIEL